MAGLLTGAAMRRLGELRTVALPSPLAGIALAVFGTGILPLVLAAGFGLGSPACSMTGYTTVMQTRTPPELQGRVMSAVETVVSVPDVVSFVIGAAVVTVLDFRVI